MIEAKRATNVGVTDRRRYVRPLNGRRDFVHHLGNAAVNVVAVERIAARDDRLRERRPESVVLLARANAAVLGVPLGALVRMADRFSSVLVLQPETVRARLAEIGGILQVARADVLVAVERTPLLLCFAEGGLQERASVLRKIIGVSGRRWRLMLRRQPDLMSRRPASIERRVAEFCDVLGLDEAGLADLIDREPALLRRSPAAIKDLLDDLVGVWAIKRKDARALLVRSPKLMRSGPVATWDRNLMRLADLLQVEFGRVLAAVRAFPSLAYQDPERIAANLKLGAKALGVAHDDLIDIVLRSPTLLVRRTADWPRRMRLLRRLTAMVGEPMTTAAILQRMPAALTYGIDRVVQRCVMARLGVGGKSWATLLSLSDERARDVLRAYFRDHAGARGWAKLLRRAKLL